MAAIDSVLNSFQTAMDAPDTGLEALKAKAGDDPDKQFQIDMIQLQKDMAMEQLLFQTISNIEKKHSETSSSIAQNLK